MGVVIGELASLAGGLGSGESRRDSPTDNLLAALTSGSGEFARRGRGGLRDCLDEVILPQPEGWMGCHASD